MSRRRLLVLLAAFFCFAGAVPASAERLKVVATIPDLADLATEIGGDRVDVIAMAKGTMNVHAVPLKPSTLIAVNQADLFLQIGLALEHAYVPGLLMRARNQRIKPGAPGFVSCSDGWDPIQVPTQVSRGVSADVHPFGNPHMNLHPLGGPHMAKHVLNGLIAVDPEGAEQYRSRYEAWMLRYEKASERWKKIGEKMRGQKVVSYHNDFDYFLAYYGITLAGTLEPQPGVPPTPRDLAKIVERMTSEDIRVVMTAKWSNTKAVRFVVEKTNGVALEAPVMVDGVRNADSWLTMMDFLHVELARALEID